MIEQTLVSGDLVKMSELEDLNGAFYDIDAQDLFDVWESMDSGNCELNGNLQGSNNNMPWNAFFRTTQTTPVLKDKLLTDSMINGEFPTAGVSTEHSYSLGRDDTGNGAASDGDSIPESPLSLQDDMETECYPCIPMQSASNQKRQSSAPFGCAQTTKMEVESNQEEDINVVDDEQQNSNDKVTYIANNVKVRNRASLVKRQANPPPTAAVNNLNNNNNSNTARVVLGGATKLPPQLRHTVRLTRPKHPQSLLKQQQPVLLMTTSMPSAPSNVQTSQSPAQLSSSIQSTATKVLTSAKLLPNTKEQLQQPQTSEVLYMTGGEWSPVSSPSSSCSSSSTSAKVAPINRTPIHTALISSQPNDGCGELVLTDEEKKTLISEGYPIPTKLPLTKAEERSLKKIRRKIKNKISAQESRRKKKEFVDTLERKVEEASAELNLYKKKCDLLQKENAALVEQVKCLRAMLEQQSANPHQNFTMKLEPDDDMDAIRNELDLD